MPALVSHDDNTRLLFLVTLEEVKEAVFLWGQDNVASSDEYINRFF